MTMALDTQTLKLATSFYTYVLCTYIMYCMYMHNDYASLCVLMITHSCHVQWTAKLASFEILSSLCILCGRIKGSGYAVRTKST